MSLTETAAQNAQNDYLEALANYPENPTQHDADTVERKRREAEWLAEAAGW